jgi:hypothetical protein
MAVNWNCDIKVKNKQIIVAITERGGACGFVLNLSPKVAAALSHELDRANHAILTDTPYECRPQKDL